MSPWYGGLDKLVVDIAALQWHCEHSLLTKMHQNVDQKFSRGAISGPLQRDRLTLLHFLVVPLAHCELHLSSHVSVRDKINFFCPRPN